MTAEIKKLELESRKKRLIISMISIFSIAVVVFVFSKSMVHADFYEDLSNEVRKLIGPEALTEEFCTLIGYMLSGEPIVAVLDKFYSSDIMNSVFGLVTGDTPMDMMVTLTVVLKTIGVLICLFNSISKMLEEMERGEMTMESYLRIMIAFVVPLVIIMEYDTIIKGLLTIGQWLYEITSVRISYSDLGILVNDYNAGGTHVTLPTPSARSIFSGTAMSGVVVYMIACGKSMTVMMLATCVVSVVIFTVLTGILSNYIEMMLRHLFMPIAIAHISHEGVRSPGMRYIKKYFGCFLKVATITVAIEAVFYVYNIIVHQAAGDFLQNWLFFFLLAPVSRQTLKICNEIISDALGD